MLFLRIVSQLYYKSSYAASRRSDNGRIQYTEIQSFSNIQRAFKHLLLTTVVYASLTNNISYGRRSLNTVMSDVLGHTPVSQCHTRNPDTLMDDGPSIEHHRDDAYVPHFTRSQSLVNTVLTFIDRQWKEPSWLRKILTQAVRESILV